jgi:hypothetical protein
MNTCEGVPIPKVTFKDNKAPNKEQKHPVS